MIDNTGQLVTPDGYPVMSDLNQPIVVDPTIPWQSTPDGAIAQNGDVFYMAMVRPRSLGDLAKVGENLFAPLAPVTPVDPDGATSERRISRIVQRPADRRDGGTDRNARGPSRRTSP